MGEALHQRLKETPFYADGQLLMQAVRKLFTRVLDTLWPEFCNEDGQFADSFIAYMKEWQEEMKHDYAISSRTRRLLLAPNAKCTSDAVKNVIAFRGTVSFFLVTGFHQHVGFVSDYYLDPELATMGWKDGEAFGRPRQHVIMTFISVFTSTLQPLLKEDYTYLFDGMVPDLGSQFKGFWNDFLVDLQHLEEEVDRRNAKRKVSNISMSPKVLESAVS